MPRLSTILAIMLFAVQVALIPGTLLAHTTNPRQQFENLAAASSLDRPGMAPWHLRVSFQLYDLDSKPAEKGTIEEWWIAPQQYRIVITSPSYNATLPSSPEELVVASRTAYLLGNLLDQIVHPVPQYKDFRDLDVERSNQKLDKIELSCLTLKLSPLMQPGSWRLREADAASSPYETFNESSSFCVEPGTDILRTHSDAGIGFLAIRDQLATFRGIEIGIDNGISFGGRLAITGRLETLEAYSPKPDELAAASAQSHLASLTPPKLLKSAKPDFEADNGSVMLCVAVSKSGTVSSVDVIYRSNKNFADARVAAVKKWKFQPALLDGKPVAATISIELGRSVRVTGG